MEKFLNLAKVRLGFVLVGVLAGGTAHANLIYNFTGDFAPSQWNLQPDQGQVGFANNNTELDITGPTGNFNDSYDLVEVVGPSQPNPNAVWPITFHWSFNSGDAQDASLSVFWPGATGGNPEVLATGGPGTPGSGDLSLVLAQGETLDILLDSGATGSGKLPATLKLSQFAYSVPDATPWAEVALLLPLLAGRFWRVVRRTV